MTTFVLKKPVQPILPIDHSALEELHLGEMPCVWVRPKPGEDLGIKTGETGVYHGTLYILNIPKGFRRVDSPAWNEDFTGSFAPQLVTGKQESHCLYLLYDLSIGPAPGGLGSFSTEAPDFCTVDGAPPPQPTTRPEADTAAAPESGTVFFDGTITPCARVFTSGDAYLVCQYDYIAGISNPALRDQLRDTFFKRVPPGPAPTVEEIERESMKPVKMLATIIPGRGIMWLPVIGAKPPLYDDFLQKKPGQYVGNYPTFLDGPNVWIGRQKKVPWGAD